MLQKTHYPDIVCLQEVGKLPPTFVFHPMYLSWNTDNDRNSIGVAILVRRAAGLEIQGVTYSPDSRAMQLQMSYNGQLIQVICVYLQSEVQPPSSVRLYFGLPLCWSPRESPPYWLETFSITQAGIHSFPSPLPPLSKPSKKSYLNIWCQLSLPPANRRGSANRDTQVPWITYLPQSRVPLWSSRFVWKYPSPLIICLS